MAERVIVRYQTIQGSGAGSLLWIETVEEDLARYFAEVERADAAIAAMPSMESGRAGHGRPLQAVLVKMIDECALHAGQAHMVRFAALGELKR